jgi:hypothetical protein
MIVLIISLLILRVKKNRSIQNITLDQFKILL